MEQSKLSAFWFWDAMKSGEVKYNCELNEIVWVYGAMRCPDKIGRLIVGHVLDRWDTRWVLFRG